MFAPDHRAVARELMRVTRPGGTIGMINFTPEGHAGDFFSTFAPVPAAPAATRRCCGAASPTCASCFDGLELDLERRDYVERVPGGPHGFVAFYRATFGPAAAIEDPRFADDLLAFARRANEGAPGGDGAALRLPARARALAGAVRPA